jgi:hypothetical protein
LALIRGYNLRELNAFEAPPEGAETYNLKELKSRRAEKVIGLRSGCLAITIRPALV